VLISQMVQDRGIVTMEDYCKISCIICTILTIIISRSWGVNIVPVNLSACKFLRSDMRLELDLNVSL